jgi:hypothetical protein
VSSSPDAIHQYVLADFVFNTHQLLDPATEAAQLGQMVGYPVGAGILVALLGHIAGAPTLLVLQPVAGLILGLGAVFAYASVTELSDGGSWTRLAIVVFCAATFLWPVAYVIGQITQDFHLTQLLGIACLLGIGYWAIVLSRGVTALPITAILGLGLALLVTYPALLPLGIATSIIAPLVGDRRPTIIQWLKNSALIAIPLVLLVLASIRDNGRAIELPFQIDGASVAPSLHSLPLAFVIAALSGAGYASISRRLRPGATLFWLTLLQTALTYGSSGLFADTARRAARDMFYVLAPELAILACVAILAGLKQLSFSLADTQQSPARSLGAAVSAVGLVGLLLFVQQAWLSQFGGLDPRPPAGPPVTLGQIALANWIGSNLPDQRLLFFTDNPTTADWIDVGFLKKQRVMGTAVTESATAADYLAWFDSVGAPKYGIVTERLNEITDIQADVLFRVGDSGVIIRRIDEPNFDPATDRVLPRGTSITSDLSLLRVVVDKHRHAPGDTLSETVMLQAADSFWRQYIAEVRLRDPTGHVLTRQAVPVTTLDLFHPIKVDVGQQVQLHIPLVISDTTPAGLYDVELVFFDDKWGTLPIHLGTGEVTPSFVVGPIVIAPSAALPAAAFRPPIQIDGNLDNKLDLVGISQPQIADGAVSFDAYWRATTKLTNSYTLFVQVLNDQGSLVGQVDTIPWSGGYPTSTWDPGQIVRDQYRVVLPANLPPGQYRIIAGAYSLQTMQRLQVLSPTGPSGSDFLALPTITLAGP